MRAVFIGGCDRSGTTLLGSMLGGAENCITTPESQFKTDVLPYCRKKDGTVDVKLAYCRIVKHWRFKLWGLRESDYDWLIQGASSYSELIKSLVKSYTIRNGKADVNVWIDHTPSNLRYAKILLDFFPEAKFVHMVRDGRAVAASVIPLDWGPNTIICAAHWWVERVAFGLAAEFFLGPERIIRVKYEDLLRKPEVTLRQLCNFFDIEFNPEMLEGKGFTPPQYTISQHRLIGRRPDFTRLEAWRTELSPRDVEIFEALTGDFLVYLGYQPLYGALAMGPSRRERVLSNMIEFLKKRVVNRFRHWIRQSVMRELM